MNGSQSLPSSNYDISNPFGPIPKFKLFADIAGSFTIEKSIVSSAKNFVRFNIPFKIIDINKKYEGTYNRIGIGTI